MTFDEAIAHADRTLQAAEHADQTERAGTLLTAANTWVRIAELIHHRDADDRDRKATPPVEQ